MENHEWLIYNSLLFLFKPDVPSIQLSIIPSSTLSLVPSLAQSDHPSQIPSKEMSKDPSNNPTSTIKPSPRQSSRPTNHPTKLKCFDHSGRQIFTLNGESRKCVYIARNKKKVCTRGDKYCANDSGKLVQDYSGICCESCNVYYNDPRCSTLTVTSAPAISCKSATIEVKLNDEINENEIILKKYNPTTEKFSIRVYSKGRKVFDKANKTYNFDVRCLETDACYLFIFRDKDKETGVSDGFNSGDGYVKVVYGGETIRFSKFNHPERSAKKFRIKFGDNCPYEYFINNDSQREWEGLIPIKGA